MESEEQSVFSVVSEEAAYVSSARENMPSRLVTFGPPTSKTKSSRTSPREKFLLKSNNSNRSNNPISPVERMYQTLATASKGPGSITHALSGQAREEYINKNRIGCHFVKFKSKSVCLDPMPLFGEEDRSSSPASNFQLQLSSELNESLVTSTDSNPNLIISSGQIVNIVRSVKFSIQEYFGLCYTLNLQLELMERPWIVFIPATKETVEITRIWTMQQILTESHRTKFTNWVLTSVTAKIEDEIITGTHFEDAKLRTAIVSELGSIAMRATIEIQRHWRGQLVRQRLAARRLELLNIEAARDIASVRIKQYRKEVEAGTREPMRAVDTTSSVGKFSSFFSGKSALYEASSFVNSSTAAVPTAPPPSKTNNNNVKNNNNSSNSNSNSNSRRNISAENNDTDNKVNGSGTPDLESLSLLADTGL